MFIKQLTVFIENRAGRLEQVTQILKDNEINIVSVSLADTSDYGLLRLILSDPDKAVSVLKEAGLCHDNECHCSKINTACRKARRVARHPFYCRCQCRIYVWINIR